MTQTGNFTEKVPDGLLSTRFPLLGSECLLQQVSHLCRCLLLYLVGGMGVGGEGESCTAVSQHAGHGLDIDSVLQSKLLLGRYFVLLGVAQRHRVLPLDGTGKEYSVI